MKKDIESIPVLSLAQGWSVHYRMERESFITELQPVEIEQPFIIQLQQKLEMK